jgi:nitrogen fixation/metabolism regulation signal transduction histidine kinase
MKNTRKKYVVDKKFQIRVSLRAIILPLITTTAMCLVLLYVAAETNRLINESNRNIDAVIGAQDSMLGFFMAVPALQNPRSTLVRQVDQTFQKNLTLVSRVHDYHERIKTNNLVVMYILVALTVAQAFLIFFQFIFFSHKISGPIRVMTDSLRELRKGTPPTFRPIRASDELQEFYNEFKKTFLHLTKK